MTQANREREMLEDRLPAEAGAGRSLQLRSVTCPPESCYLAWQELCFV